MAKQPQPQFTIGQRVILVDERTGVGVYMKLTKANSSRVILEPIKEPPVKWSEVKV